jgi:hypothetical protein
MHVGNEQRAACGPVQRALGVEQYFFTGNALTQRRAVSVINSGQGAGRSFRCVQRKGNATWMHRL